MPEVLEQLRDELELLDLPRENVVVAEAEPGRFRFSIVGMPEAIATHLANALASDEPRFLPVPGMALRCGETERVGIVVERSARAVRLRSPVASTPLNDWEAHPRHLRPALLAEIDAARLRPAAPPGGGGHA